MNRRPPADDSAVGVFVDCDAHITEPADVWTDRVSSKWGDLVPHVRFVEDANFPQLWYMAGRGLDVWFIGGEPHMPAWASAAAGWTEPLPTFPPTMADALPASYDAKARLAVMDEMGIAAQVLYPNVAGFGAYHFRNLPPELGVECVRAYNDFLVDWIAPDPRRFVPVASLPYWDVTASVAEVQRVAGLGFRAIVFSGCPQVWDQPYLASRHWDPLWAAAQECGLSVSLHAGSGNFTAHLTRTQVELEGFVSSWARASTQILLDHAGQVSDLVMSGILPRFPNLTFVSAESGIGWVPFVLESLDYAFVDNRVGHDRPEFEALPSEYFHRQVKVCTWFEHTAPERLLDRIGVDNVLFETDFPHSVCLTPEQTRAAIDDLAAIPAASRAKLLFENACDLYGVSRDLVAPT
jgi:predicted TIM-barrel fold metal-dependent hydrolase